MTIIVFVSWGMVIMLWYFYASFTVMIWTGSCQTLVYRVLMVSWYYENKVEWYDYMLGSGCYSHILIIIMTSKKESVIIT